jgi:type II secretory ATPase GspE/PulE/Tfp pilus assembly ATPase PilB-like protein
VDGVLTEVAGVPKELHRRIISRLKVLANLVIYRQSVPQDGSIMTVIGGTHYDVRVSLMPTLHGEKAVIRIMEGEELLSDLSQLGLQGDILQTYETYLKKPQGMVVFTGPTGCGKTTTIYCSLRRVLELSDGTKHISTIEDPIEYDLSFLTQTQVNMETGLTFAKGLRSILRQDPNVIMVGEIRDPETAQIAVQAGLTGHLMFTSLHADQPSAVFSRLISIGLEPYLVASCLLAVVTQRLVRKICPNCRERTIPSPALLRLVGLSHESDITFYHGVGCDLCMGKGLVGRTGIFEVVPADETIRNLISEKASPAKVNEYCRSMGLPTLLDDGLSKVKQGITTLEEVIRVAG